MSYLVVSLRVCRCCITLTNTFIMKRVYRFALMNFIGIIGASLTAIGVWSAYLSMNNDWLILAVFGALVTWFYIEVVTPDNKPKVVKKVNIEDKDYISIFNNK